MMITSPFRSGGISGGGAATSWIAAADERVQVAVPVSGMADLPSYVPNRVINGHCDCMFLYNTFQWPWTRIAGMIAPRPLTISGRATEALAKTAAIYATAGKPDRFIARED